MKKICLIIPLLFFMALLCKPQSCTTWLKTPLFPSSVSVGDLDITGNQLTVEINFNSIANSSNGSWGHIVSKHTGADNVNYAISSNAAEITTTNGYAVVFETCPILLNKTYHAAMVYDGVTLKFYRNGFLMGQAPWTGDLVNNDLLTTISQIAGTSVSGEQFTGYVNEVRIWNVARSQAQLQTYMNTSLPTPTTQTGLKGYYTFDNLLNKQGNTAFNGTINGPATINNTNPNCNFVADYCPVNTTISNIINDYTPVLAFDICKNILTVEDGTKYKAGDTVLLIQMKGAVIDSSNTAAFGTITNYKNAGNYEFNYVKNKTGNQIELLNNLTRQYDIPIGKVQLIRVPYYNNANISATLTCLPWDGNKGGVLVFNVQDTVILNANIDVTGKGFGKGVMHNSNFNGYTCGISDYYYLDNTIYAAGKGEGISKLSATKNSGKGPAANGGGGGMDTNSGGGGGSNGNLGGRGGYELNLCPNHLTSQNWGLPGKTLLYNNVQNKIFLGGGGGAGHCNNQYYAPNENADFNGGNGGGLIIINSNYLLNNSNNKIIAKGDSAYELNLPFSFVSHDGMGGGGAGGTAILNINNYINNLSLDVSGGKGGDMVSMPAGGLIGPGGGGGGGVVWLKQNIVPVNLNITNIGGKGGVIIQNGNDPYGTTPGLNGINIFNLIVPFDALPFKNNIDSVRIKDSATSCSAFNFKGLAFTNNAAITNWQWFFGDGGTANTQNTTHNYLTTGANTVKLIVTDINGCKDSIAKPVTFSIVNANAGNDTTICKNNPTILNGSGNGISFAWIPKIFLNDSTLQNPTAIISTTTKFYLVVKNALGCSEKDSVTLSVRPNPVFNISPSSSTCPGTNTQLSAAGGNIYLWSPANLVSNAAIPNPLAIASTTTNYSVTITENICNISSTLSTTVTVNPQPQVTATKSNDIDCSFNFANLLASGAAQYIWSPAATLSNANISNPVATPNATMQYIVKGTNAFGCSDFDTITVAVTQMGKSGYFMPNTFTPNGDGINDCFGIRYWGVIEELEFFIYNRYGEKVFYTNDPNKCWNGKYKTEKPEPGNYVYYIKAKTTCGTVEKKGNVLLIR